MYLAEHFIEAAEDLLIILKRTQRGAPILITVSRAEMTKQQVKTADIKDAPSLVLSRDRGPAGETAVSFICARLQSVIVLAAKASVGPRL